MVLLYIKNIKNENIKIINKKNFFRILYSLNDNVTISKLLVKLDNIKVSINNNNIKIYRNDFSDLIILNNHINKYIKCSNIINNSDNGDYILIPNNKYTRDINNYDYVYVYIKYVKKSNNIPIIHLIYGK